MSLSGAPRYRHHERLMARIILFHRRDATISSSGPYSECGGEGAMERRQPAQAPAPARYEPHAIGATHAWYRLRGYREGHIPELPLPGRDRGRAPTSKICDAISSARYQGVAELHHGVRINGRRRGLLP
jgi:hypothetical protein